MPTSNNEAENIVKISQEYIPMDKMKELFVRLDEEVGAFSNNDSLKVSLKMMRSLVENF
jgi:hypothetical protein